MMKKDYTSPSVANVRITALIPMAISVRLGEGSDTDPTSDRSHRFWGGSIFDEEDDAIEEEESAF